MSRLQCRVARLEGPESIATLTPALRKWLGQPVSDAELAEFEARPKTESAEIDTSKWSEGLKEWLGVA